MEIRNALTCPACGGTRIHYDDRDDNHSCCPSPWAFCAGCDFAVQDYALGEHDELLTREEHARNVWNSAVLNAKKLAQTRRVFMGYTYEQLEICRAVLKENPKFFAWDNWQKIEQFTEGVKFAFEHMRQSFEAELDEMDGRECAVMRARFYLDFQDKQKEDEE